MGPPVSPMGSFTQTRDNVDVATSSVDLDVSFEGDVDGDVDPDYERNRRRILSGRGVVATLPLALNDAAVSSKQAGQIQLAPIQGQNSAVLTPRTLQLDNNNNNNNGNNNNGEHTTQHIPFQRKSPTSVLRGPDWLSSVSYPSDEMPKTRCPASSRFDKDSPFAKNAVAASKDRASTPRISPSLLDSGALTPRNLLPAVVHTPRSIETTTAALVQPPPVPPATAAGSVGRPPLSPRLSLGSGLAYTQRAPPPLNPIRPHPNASTAAQAPPDRRQVFEVLDTNLTMNATQASRANTSCGRLMRSSSEGLNNVRLSVPALPIMTSLPLMTNTLIDGSGSDVQTWSADVIRPTVQGKAQLARVR
ncbi:hypothetical protein NFJ02_04g114560 [Pycnococcus provasolii]